MENEEKFSSLESLEFELLEDLNEYKERYENSDFGIDGGFLSKFEELFQYSYKHLQIVKVLFELKDKSFCIDDEKNIWIINKLFEANSYLYKLGKKPYNKISKEIFTEEFFLKLPKSFKELEDEEVNGKLDCEKLKKLMEKKEKEFLEEKIEEEKKEKERVIDNKEDYEKGILVKFDCGCSVEDKEIIYNRDEKFNKIVLNKKVNNILGYNYFGQSNRYSIYPEETIKLLTEKREDFNLFKNNVLLFEIKFEENKNFINKVKVKRDKINFILKKIKVEENENKEKIELLNNLTQMKTDFLELKEIKFNFYSNNSNRDFNFLIDIKLIDEDNFSIYFMNKEKIFSWDRVKHFFFDGGSRRSVYCWFNKEEILSFCDYFEISKKELFDELKKLSILGVL